MAQQTAVDFLLENIHLLHSLKWNDVIEQAKQMEKQQIIEAAKINLWCAIGDGSDQAEEYYNETYGK